MRPNLHLLLIEPYPQLARPLRRGLEDEGFIVDTASDWAEADLWMERKHYDVILMDVPAGHKPTLLQEWLWARPNIPVLVLTSAVNGKENLAELSLWPKDVLQKPFALEELLARLRTLTGE